MLDALLRPLIDPPLNAAGRRLSAWGVGANAITWTGFALGLAAAVAAGAAAYWAALALFLLNRLADGVDGGIARAGKVTDRGGYLDIVLDFTVYGAIPLGFVVADPAANALPGAVLLFSFYVNGASFLAFSALAARRGIESTAHGTKSLHYTSGLAEGTETILAFVLFCLFPAWFWLLAYAFATMTLVTAASRVLLAIRIFR